MKKSLKSIIFLVIIGILVIALAFFVLKMMDQPKETTSSSKSQPVAITKAKPITKPISKPIPIQTGNAGKNTQPGPSTQTPGEEIPISTQDAQQKPTPIVESEIPVEDISMQKIPPVPKQEMPSETQSPEEHMPAQVETTSEEKTMPVQKPEEPKTSPVHQELQASAPAEPQKAEALSAKADKDFRFSLGSIDFKESNGRLEMQIRANGPIEKYKFFLLSNPTRLVIDLMGSWQKPQFLEKDVNTSRISKIRLWRHKDKLRIVGDLTSNMPISPDFQTYSNGLIMIVK